MGGCYTRRCTVPGGGTQVGHRNNTIQIVRPQEKKNGTARLDKENEYQIVPF